MKRVAIPGSSFLDEGILSIERGDYPIRLRKVEQALAKLGCGVSVVRSAHGSGGYTCEKQPFIDFGDGLGPHVYPTTEILKGAIRGANHVFRERGQIQAQAVGT